MAESVILPAAFITTLMYTCKNTNVISALQASPSYDASGGDCWNDFIFESIIATDPAGTHRAEIFAFLRKYHVLFDSHYSQL